MASLRVLAFDPEGRPVAFDTWHNDLQLYLLSDLKDSVSLFDHESGAAPAPPATADALYDAVVARYSSPATVAIGRLLLPYLFPELSPPMFITFYFIVTRLPDSLRSVKDHFLTLDPTSFTVDLLEQHLLAAETSAVAVGAARGTPRSPFFEGCSPSPLSPFFASSAAADVSVPEDVGAASTSAKRRNSKGKGGRGSGGGSGGGGGGSGSGSGGSGKGGGGGRGGGGSGTGGRSGGSGGGGGGSGGSGGSGGGGTGGGRSGPRRGGPGGSEGQQQQRWSETQTPSQLRIAAAALGASASGTPPGTAPAEALHTFTLDSGASRCFFRDSTTLTPLPAPVSVRLADPSGGPVVARSSSVLPFRAVPSSSLSDLHLPSFSTNLVNTAALQDAMVTTTTPGGQRVSICTCTRTGRHLATFTRRPRSSLYTLATKPPQVAVSTQVSASGQVAASCSCRLLSHQTLLWHHRLGHPSLPRLRGMHSRLLVSGLPRSLPPLPPSPAPPCLPCVEGRQRAAPHSSSFPPTTAPLKTLHMDVWGPARVSGQGREHYNLLVVDDYTRYTTVFPLRRKGEVVEVLIPWIRTVRLQRREQFGQDHPVLRLYSNRGGEFSSDLLRDFFMEVARTSMIHAAAPHFLWPFAKTLHTLRWTGKVGASSVFRWRYAAPQLNLWPHVSLPETLPTLRWTGKVGDASVFRVWGSRALVRDTSADKLSAHAIPCGPAPLGVSQVVPLLGSAPYQVAVVSGAAPGAASGGAASGGAASGGAEPGGAGSEGAGSRGAEPEGVESGGAESEGAESGVLSLGWLVRCAHRRSGAPGVGGAGNIRARGSAITTGAGGTGGTAAIGPGGARTNGAGAAGTGGVGCAGVGDPTEPGAAGTGGAGAGVAGSVPVNPPSVGGECALGTDVLEDRQEKFESLAAAVPRFASMLLAIEGDPDALDISTPRSYAEAITGPYSSQWQETMDAEMASWKSTGTYVVKVPPRRHVDFLGELDTRYSVEPSPASLRSPPGVSRVARHTQDYTCGSWVGSFTADPSLFLRTDTSLPPFYVLVYVDDLVFATADTEALTLVKSELQKRHTCTDLGELRSYLDLQITRDRARRTITLTRSHMVHQDLQRFGFQFSSPQPTPLSTSHSLSAPPSDKSVEPSGPYPELVGCLMYLMTCTRPDLAYPLGLLARYVAPGKH
ncbi:unnamed protein product [Closterium sp. NIES-54]